ncbi:MAG: DNA gyrase C-terminal beta-propeller domain-containing protein, partial [Candidatus Cloacimonadaceae bacterium]
ARNGYMASLMLVDDSEELMIITQEGMIIRQNIKDISLVSRNTQGVRLINLNENDKVRDITNVPNEDDEEIIEKGVKKLKEAPVRAAKPQPADDDEPDPSDIDGDYSDEDIDQDDES